MKQKAGLIQIVAVLIIILAILLVAWVVFPRKQSTIEVDTTVDPQNFKTSQSSILTLKIQSKDEASVHHVVLKFITNNLVQIYLGSKELTKETPDAGNYTFVFELLPAQKTEQPFQVKVTGLPMGIASQEFSIRLEVYLDDGLLTAREVRFKVEEG